MSVEESGGRKIDETRMEKAVKKEEKKERRKLMIEEKKQ